MFCLRCGSRNITANWEEVDGLDAEVEYEKCHQCSFIFGIQISGPDAELLRKEPVGEIRYWNVPGLTRIFWYPNPERRVRYIGS